MVMVMAVPFGGAGRCLGSARGSAIISRVSLGLSSSILARVKGVGIGGAGERKPRQDSALSPYLVFD